MGYVGADVARTNIVDIAASLDQVWIPYVNDGDEVSATVVDEQRSYLIWKDLALQAEEQLHSDPGSPDRTTPCLWYI